MVLVFGDFVKYFVYPMHILILKTFMIPCQAGKSLESLMYLNGITIYIYIIKYLMYLIHIQIEKTLGEHYVPWKRFPGWKTFGKFNVFKGYPNLLNLLKTLCIYVVSQVYSKVGNNPFPSVLKMLNTYIQESLLYKAETPSQESGATGMWRKQTRQCLHEW